MVGSLAYTETIPDFAEGYGKFYFNLNNSDGVIVCPSKLSDPVYLGDGNEYDILITKSSEDEYKDSELELTLTRVVDGDVLFEDRNTFLISSYSSRRILETDKFTIGNTHQKSFIGTLDRLRVYAEKLSHDRFLSHINHNQGYDIDIASNLKETLLVKVNFDYPYDITGEPGKIKNYILDDTNSYISAYNFTKKDFPHDFVGKTRREFVKLPSFGSQTFNNNKIRIEQQKKIAPLSSTGRSTKKSFDRNSVDTNSLGVYFSPSDIISREIMRFLGDFDLGNLIGDPKDTYKPSYNKLDSFKKIFFDNRFGNFDIQKYFNLIKSYIDPSLFDNIEKLVPARANLVSGLLVEPTLLERNKIIPPRIKSHSWVTGGEKTHNKDKITEIVEIKFDVLSPNTKNKNIFSFANSRTYTKGGSDEFKLMHEADIQFNTTQSRYTYDYNFGGSFVGESDSDKTKDLFAVHGYVDYKNNRYKLEKTKTKLKLGTEYGGGYVDYDVLLNDGIQVSGFTDGLEMANGVYEYKLRGSSSGLPIFSNENRMWWVFYSSTKGSWILASDNTVGGGKKLALGKERNYENYSWISGNKIVDNSTNTPDWFSTGFLNSLDSDNLPNKNIDYFARVNFISKYNRFIEVNAYLQGWINAKLVGVYNGAYTERIADELGNVISDDVFVKDSYVFGGGKTYVYLNGTFKGKLQDGWVGGPNINEEDVDKVIRIVGDFNGTNYESCENPFYTSGDINSIVSFNNRDKLVFDFRNFESDEVRFTEKNFNSTNLVKIPNTIVTKNKFDFKFLGNFNVRAEGTSETNNFSSGVYSTSHLYKTLDIFNPPNIYDCQIKFDVNMKSSAILDAEIFAKRIDHDFEDSSLTKLINKEPYFK